MQKVSAANRCSATLESAPGSEERFLSSLGKVDSESRHDAFSIFQDAVVPSFL